MSESLTPPPITGYQPLILERGCSAASSHCTTLFSGSSQGLIPQRQDPVALEKQPLSSHQLTPPSLQSTAPPRSLGPYHSQPVTGPYPAVLTRAHFPHALLLSCGEQRPKMQPAVSPTVARSAFQSAIGSETASVGSANGEYYLVMENGDMIRSMIAPSH